MVETKIEKLFKPNGNLMTQLSGLTKENASNWYVEYLEYHKGVDQGVDYLVGYFDSKTTKMLRGAFVKGQKIYDKQKEKKI